MVASTYESVIFQYTGENGFFQFSVCSLILILSFVNQDPYVFITQEPLHWCSVPRLANFSHKQQKYIAIPYDHDDEEYEKCDRFDMDFNGMTDEELFSWNRLVIICIH